MVICTNKFGSKMPCMISAIIQCPRKMLGCDWFKMATIENCLNTFSTYNLRMKAHDSCCDDYFDYHQFDGRSSVLCP